jgi:RHS repeat-associated protein
MNRIVRLLCASLIGVSSIAAAQNLGTGLYAFGSFDSRGFDSVNIGNLNTHFEIPIVNKQGRGLPFNYSLVYEGLVWSSSTNSGTGYWQPDSGWGFHGQLLGGAIVGFLTYADKSTTCPPPDGLHRNVTGDLLTNYVYHDPYGRNHRFNYSVKLCPVTDPNDSGTPSGDGNSNDGSGLSLNINDLTVHTRSGQIINTTLSSGTSAASITDTNGNTVTNNGNGTFTDTMGVTALTIGGAGTAASPLTLSYPVTLQSDSATTATATAYYTTYTVQTNFQCSGITEYGATSVDLMDHITLADGSSTYSFTYEPTPGVSGAVTGRLASITLPTGGTINYSYTGGCNGSGINADGTVGSLTRTTTDGSRSYTRAPVNANASSTTVQDEKGNQSIYWFSSANGLFYETHQGVYQGAIGGPNLLDKYTCYNGAQPDCSGAVVTPPFTQTLAVTSYNNGVQDSVQNSYDSSGMLTATLKGQWGGSTLQTQSFLYNASEQVTKAKTFDGSTNLVAETDYGYDETAPTGTTNLGIPQHTVVSSTPGNQTSVQVSTGSGTLATTTVYYDTGVPVSTTTPNGTTNYSYESTQTFATTTTLPPPSSGVSLATSASYDQQSGALISATGMNAGQISQVTQYDRLLRPLSMSLPNGGQISNTIFSVLDTGNAQTMGNGKSTNVRTLVDGYGRKSRVAVYNGQPSNQWYQIDYCYDGTGLLQFQTVPYQGNGWATSKQCSGAGTSYTYDALGRMTSSTNADGTTTHQYNGRAFKTTDVNGVQKITQYDLLGRISAVCEVSGSTLQGDPPVDCGMDIAGTGFRTVYSYDLLNHKTTITQGVQTRVFQTDAAGRTISTSEPERGVTTYNYSYSGASPCTSAGLCVKRTRSRANQTDPTVLTTTTTQYDPVGRVLSISYDDGTPTKNFAYDASVGWAILNQTNVKGVLSAAWIGSTAASVFSYDPMGRVTAMAECLPLWCGNSPLDRRLDFSYDLTGNQATASDGAGTTTTYTYSPASEITSISSSMSGTTYPSSLLSNVQNGPYGPFIYGLGNGVSVNLTYDGLGRSNGRWVCYGSNQTYATNQMYCPGGTQLYAYEVTWQGQRATSSADTALAQGHWYGYDEFNRLQSSTVNFGTVQNFTYVYDRYGNRWQQNAPQGGTAPSYSFNKNNNQIYGYSYDAAGNMTSDGFHSYTYDAEGNITDVDGNAGAVYIYNALNQRVQVDWPTVSHQYVYNASGQRVSVWDTNTHAQVQGQYYWGSTPIAFYDSGSLHFQHQDWMGTEQARTSYNGSTEGIYTSLPWGDEYSASGSDNDPYHFAQLDRDSESDTHHAQFRQYSSTQGRWMSPDPYNGSYDAGNPQSLNRYSYVLNNPLSMTDPSGQDQVACDDFAITCFDGGGGVGGGGGGDTVTIGTVLQSVDVTTTPLPPIDIPTIWNWITAGIPNLPSSGGYSAAGSNPAPAPSEGFFHSRFCSAASDLLNLASATNATVGAGAGGSVGVLAFFGGSLAGGVQAVADPSGNLGIAINVSPGFIGFGASAMGGFQGSVSTSKSIFGLGGWSLSGDLSAGAGPAVDLGVSRGFSSWLGPTQWGATTVTATVGPGIGTRAAVGSVGYSFVPHSLSTNCRKK